MLPYFSILNSVNGSIDGDTGKSGTNDLVLLLNNLEEEIENKKLFFQKETNKGIIKMERMKSNLLSQIRNELKSALYSRKDILNVHKKTLLREIKF